MNTPPSNHRQNSFGRRPTGARARLARGQAMVEYLLIVLSLSALLFAPTVPNPRGGGLVSIFFLFITTFDIYLDSFHFVISLPIP